MESWEVLRDAVDVVGVKAVARELRVSTALIYKWCQPPTVGEDDASGALNPLDRLRSIYELTQDPRLINWLCMIAGGFYVRNPSAPAATSDVQLLGVTQQVVQDFGDLLTDISRGIANDGRITPEEADTIRQSWERLKTAAERFVVACERGNYNQAVRR